MYDDVVDELCAIVHGNRALIAVMATLASLACFGMAWSTWVG